MSPRYPLPDYGDSRYPARDSSPPRYSDRRSSSSYNGGPSSARIADSNYRSFDANAHQQSARDPPREPPRGPKALDTPRGGYPPRGRGFSARGDFRDREFRDSRDGPSSRGARDRDWAYRVSSDRRPSPPPPRGRTRSPQRDYGRETRDYTARDSDRDRPRRDPPLEPSYPISSRGRGSYRGRGRGEWDYGYRGRGGHAEDRDAARFRSRSQDRAWDRPQRDDRDRDRGRDRDHEPIRRDDEYRRPWEDKDRDLEKYRRDPPFRPDSRNSSATNPSTPRSATGLQPTQMNSDRTNHTYRGLSPDTGRRSSGPYPTPNHSVPFQRIDGPPPRLERDRPIKHAVQPPSSPPQAPQVPAFGSVSYKPTLITKASTGNSSLSQPSPITKETVKQPPLAPKAQLLSHAPTAPRAEQRSDRSMPNDLNPQDERITGIDKSNAAGTASTTALSRPKSFTVDHPGDSRPNPQTLSQARQPSETTLPRPSGQDPRPQASERSNSLQMVHPSRREVIEESGRQEISGGYLGRHSHRESPHVSQQSPAKIPTGPRAERATTSIRQVAPPAPRALSSRASIPQWGRGQANLTWVRPGLTQGPPQHAPRGPSIMNTVPTKRDNAGEEKVKTPFPETDDRDPFDAPWNQDGTSLKAALDAAKAEGERPISNDKHTTAAVIEQKSPEEERTSTKARSPPPSSSGSPQARLKEGVEDASLDLDDDDYEVAERNFNREMRILEARRPPSPLRDPELISLLEECDALASAAEDLANGFIPRVAAEKALPQTGLPSPKVEESEEKMDTAAEIALGVHFSVDRQQTPPIESLPFLASGPPTPFSQIDDLQHHASLEELVRCRIEDNLTIECEQLDNQYEETKACFAAGYRTWRMKNLELEEQEKERNEAAPPPAPEDTLPTMGATIPSISGKSSRVMRNTSDLQMETALKLSEQTAAEEAEKRAHHQTGDRGPNVDKEASIPNMLTEKESVMSLFDDRNNLVASASVLEALAFVPKKDDFSAEEHDKFIDHYILNPKRWGTIAELLPGRTYQDCVQHYYLTKGICAYKEKEKAFLRIKKGRRGPRGQQRAKSSNLIPSYDGNTEADLTSTAVTETGRPKRTAAPVFGPSGDVEAATPLSTPVKTTSARTKTEPNGEPSAEKPRRRGAAAKERMTRKGKAPLLAAAPGPSPPKSEKDSARGRSREPKLEIDQRSEDLEGAQLLAGLQSSHVLGPSQHPLVENWVNRQPILTNPVVSGSLEPQQPSFEAQLQATEQRSGPTPTSSYWSVPEHQNFQSLLGHFGTNWQAIADTMKTKSVTMVNDSSLLDRALPLSGLKQNSEQVRNYYNRESQKDGGEFFKQIAQIADDKIKRGEDMGPLPTPTVHPTKRRNDATPQISAQRTLAPSVDPSDVEPDTSQMQPSKSVHLSPTQVQTSTPRYPALVQADPAPMPVFSQTASQGLSGNISRAQQSSQQRGPQLQGPRSGFFSDERSRPILQAQPAIDAQKQRSIHQEDESRIRSHEAQSRRDTRRQEFLDNLEKQHHIRHGEQATSQPLLQHHYPRHADPAQPTVQPHQPPSRSQSTAVSQPFFPPNQPTSSQVRIAPSQPLETEPRRRFNSQPQQSQLEAIKQEPPTAFRRQDLDPQEQSRQSIVQSSPKGRMPLSISTPAENVRHGLASVLTPQPPPKPAPAQAKRSNIMSILNDEPSEPAPPRKRAEDSVSVVPKSTQPPPMSVPQTYQPSQSSQQLATARDQGLERPVHSLQQQNRISLSQASVQQQQQQQQQQQVQQQAQGREAPSTWVAAAQRLEQERTGFPSPPVNSPHSQPIYLQSSTRAPFQSIQRGHAPSPPTATYSHSRTSSYTGGLPQHIQQQSTQPRPGKAASQTPVQAAPNLQPSPYATIQPQQPTPSQQHQQQVVQQQARAHQEQMQRHLDEQRHQEMQRRSRQEALLQQEVGTVGYLPYQPQQRAQDVSRRLSEQTGLLHPKDTGYGGGDRHQSRLVQYQETLMRQEQERRQEQSRREQGRVYTPPIYQSHAYAPPPSQQQQQQQQQRGQGPGR
ncbi:MAG: hypothetical protein Q9219_002363 [cf. Caloplaca sp. 3 TL-2023]